MVKNFEIEKGKMSGDRITYRNLGEIFVIEIEEKNIEVGIIEGLPEEYFPDPFNKYVVIRNLYKYPDRVKAYAEACQYTNCIGATGAAPVIRSYAPMTGVFAYVVCPALNDAFGRKFAPKLARQADIDIATFSYYTPQVIEYHKYHEPHIDGESWISLHSTRPGTDMKKHIEQGGEVDFKFKSIAGTIYLDETFGTEIFLNNHTSHYYSKDSELWGTPPWYKENVGVYPEGSDSCYKPLIKVGGEYNSMAFYYDIIFHRPNYPDASDEDLKHGRLIQNIWFDDITEDDSPLWKK